MVLCLTLSTVPYSCKQRISTNRTYKITMQLFFVGVWVSAHTELCSNDRMWNTKQGAQRFWQTQTNRSDLVETLHSFWAYVDNGWKLLWIIYMTNICSFGSFHERNVMRTFFFISFVSFLRIVGCCCCCFFNKTELITLIPKNINIQVSYSNYNDNDYNESVLVKRGFELFRLWKSKKKEWNSNQRIQFSTNHGH